MRKMNGVSRGLLIVLITLLVGCTGTKTEEKAIGPDSAYAGVDGFYTEGDFFTTMRRADIVSENGFNFTVTYFESTFKQYLKEPYLLVFKVFVKNSPERGGAGLQMSMCSATQVCVYDASGGSISTELHRTNVLPANTDMPRNGFWIWSNMSIDNDLWRISLSNTRNAVVVPSWPKKRFPPSYIRYRNYLEII